MPEKIVVHLESLGLCEHCGELISMMNLPMDSMDAVWKCRSCQGELHEESFGYEDRKKVRWVGPGKQWVSEKPTTDFEIGNWEIFVNFRMVHPW